MRGVRRFQINFQTLLSFLEEEEVGTEVDSCVAPCHCECDEVDKTFKDGEVILQENQWS